MAEKPGTDKADAIEVLNRPDSIARLLDKAREEGSARLLHLDEEERTQLLYWYKNNFKKLEGREVVDFLEEFLAYRMVADSEALDFLEGLLPEEMSRLGIFIGRNTSPGRYPLTFYQCWDYLDLETRSGFVERFTKDEPEYAVMLATKVNLDETFIKKNLGWLERAKPFIETFIAHYEYQAAQGNVWSVRYGTHRNLQAIIDASPWALYPYLERLEKLSLISQSDLNLFLDPERLFSHIFSCQDESPEEKREIERIIKKIQKVSPGGESRYYYSADAPGKEPRNLTARIGEIRARQKRRVGEHIMSGFSFIRERLDDPNDFLMASISRGGPIFYKPELLGMDRQGIVNLMSKIESRDGDFFAGFEGFDLGEVYALLEFNRNAGADGGPDLEKLIVGKMIQEIISEQDNLTINRLLVMNAPDSLNHFSEIQRQAIIRAINEYAPQLWIVNLGYALSYSGLSAEVLFDKLFGKGTSKTLEYFNRVLYHYRLLKKDGKLTEDFFSIMKERASRYIEENPAILLSQSQQAAVKELFTPQEIDRIIQDQLQREHPDGYFVQSLMYSGRAKEFKGRIKELIAGHSEMLPILAYSIQGVDALLSLVPPEDFFEAAFAHPDDLNWEGIFESPAVIRYVADLSAVEKSEFIERIAGIGSRALASMRLTMDFELESNEKYMKNDIEALKKMRAASSGERKPRRVAGEAGQKESGAGVDTDSEAIERIKENLQERKNKNLPTHKQMKSFLDEASSVLESLAESRPGSVFDKGVIRVLDSKATPYIARDIEGYAELSPELLTEYPSNRTDWADYIGVERYASLFRKNIRFLTFTKNKFGKRRFTLGRMHQDLAAEAERLNPVMAIETQPRLREDYYDEVMAKLADKMLWPVYKRRMGELAKREQASYDNQYVPERVTVNKDFALLGDRILLIESIPFLRSLAPDILSLPEASREPLLDLLEFIAVNDMQDDLEEATQIKGGALKEAAMSLMIEECRRVFEVDEGSGIRFDRFPVRTLRALEIYWRNTCRSDPKMRELFQTILTKDEESFRVWRAWDTDEAPVNSSETGDRLDLLKERKLIPSKTEPEAYMAWYADDTIDFDETVQYELKDIRAGVESILRQALADRHVGPEILDMQPQEVEDKYKIVLLPLENFMQEKQQLFERTEILRKNPERTAEETKELESLRRKYREIQVRIKEYMTEYGGSIQHLKALRYLRRLEHVGANEIQSEKLTVDGKHVLLKDVAKAFNEGFSEFPDFVTDLHRVLDILKQAKDQIFGQRVSRLRLSITDKVNISKHLFIGERPVPSCQHYAGTPSLNKGLLSYISDPAVKIIQVCDENNDIVARAVMRLLEDESGEPQIFLERVYSANPHTKITEAIATFAKNKARIMKVNVYSKEVSKSDTSPDYDGATLKSNGSRSSFIYTDVGGLERDGVFEVTGAMKL